MKGQTLIETILAVAVIGIIVSGLSVLVVSALSNAGFVRNQSLASEYAQEGLEVVRSIRNSNYTAFAGYNGYYCLAGDATTLTVLTSPATVCAENVDSTFKRTVRIQQGTCDVGISSITVKVEWTDSKCATGVYCHKSHLVSCLSTINPIPTP